MAKKVYIVSADFGYSLMFTREGWEITKSLEEADLVQFTGGSDVSPSLYNEAVHPKTYFDKTRDDYEISIFNKAIEMGIPCAGICRGGQFLNVMNGGRMFQHVNNHGWAHDAELPGLLKKVKVSSTHHQMMRVNNAIENLVLLHAKESTVREWMGKNQILKDINPSSEDIEAVYYPQNNCLCFQPHPEFDGYIDCRRVYFYFINNYLMTNASLEEAREISKQTPGI